MFVKKLNIVNFKNHEAREFVFGGKINCLVGSNGVGKTNVLDALYYLSFSKSFINAADIQNIRLGEEFFSLRFLVAWCLRRGRGGGGDTVVVP